MFNDLLNRQAWLAEYCDVTTLRIFFLEKIVKIIFNNYLLLNDIELVHFFTFYFPTYKLLFNVSQKALWVLSGASL